MQVIWSVLRSYLICYILYSATWGLLSFLDIQELCFQLRKEHLQILKELIVKQWTPLLEITFIKDNWSGINQKGINKPLHSETIQW